MANSWLDSFSVALGFEVNTASLNTAKKSIADYEKAVRDAEARVLRAREENAKAEVQIEARRQADRAKAALAEQTRAQTTEKAETEQSRARVERARNFGLAMSRMATAATAAATAIAYAVAKVAGSFDNLYFQAQRSGTSVGSLKALGYAFQQTGGTAQQAGAAVDSFTTALRNNPGLRQFVKDLGVNESLQGVDKLLATVDALKKEPYEVGVQHASMLGISEQDFNLFSRQGEALKRYREEYEATAKSFGMNSDQAAATATAFQRSLTRLQASVEILGQKLLVQVAPVLERIFTGISNWLESNPDKVESFFSLWDSFSTRVGVVANAFEGLWAILKKIDEWLHLSTIYKFLEKLGVGIMSGKVNPGAILLNQFGGGGGLGAGTVGGFNPLEGGEGGAGAGGGGADDRNLWQRHAPKWLGGKDAPAAGDGSRSWRNNNPGNIKYGPFAQRMGATGADSGGFARFPSYEAGRKAQEGLMFDSAGYKDLTIRQAIARWAPASDGNDPEGYAGQMAKAAGVGADTKLSELTPDQRSRFLDAQQHKEGWIPGAAAAKQVAGGVAPVNGVGGVVQAQSGAERRRQPITDRLMGQLATAATAAGANVEVYSGGQDDHGRMRKGSHRHDHGNAADVRLYVNNPDGSKRYLSMNNEADRKQMETFLREGVKAGANGIGAGPGYMGDRGIHIGGGSVAAWGAGGSSANAPDWVRRALEQGLQERGRPGASPAARAPAPNMIPGGFDVNRISPRDVMRAAPLGAGATNSTSNDNRAVNQTFHTTTTINEARNTREAGRVMEGSFSRMHSMALANAQSAVA